MKKPVYFFVLAFILGCSETHASQETLPGTVKQQQGNIEFQIVREFPPADLSELVDDCDLIARVIIATDGQSYLSTDERAMYSDYTAQVLTPVFARQPLEPGDRLIIRKPGGTMVVDGHQVTTIERDFPRFLRGDEYIVFLKLHRSTGRYTLPVGAQSAFRNVDGFVEQVSRTTGKWNNERGRVPIAVFLDEVHEILNSR